MFLFLLIGTVNRVYVWPFQNLTEQMMTVIQFNTIPVADVVSKMQGGLVNNMVSSKGILIILFRKLFFRLSRIVTYDYLEV